MVSKRSEVRDVTVLEFSQLGKNEKLRSQMHLGPRVGVEVGWGGVERAHYWICGELSAAWVLPRTFRRPG